MGPVGVQVVALQNLRQELAPPPPTFDQLARALVPVLPPERTASDPTGPTPKPLFRPRLRALRALRDRRELCDAPGTYQVRVIAPAGSGPASASTGRAGSAGASGGIAPLGSVAPNSAGVPFTNIDIVLKIPYEYRLRGSTESDPFATVVQSHD